ncbi:MAG: methionyl-tRNA formyltransferase [Clostridiales bacterium]|jgi:methionyl-tRNA formyltransferase|nr:methionyl-tRNA formyltransferase [Clostridiales bacterium]
MIVSILFMGTPEFAVPCFHMLLEEGYDVVGAVTQPDRPKGRGGKLAVPPVKEAALAAGVRVLQPERPGDAYDEFAALGADLIVTAAYGGILRKRLLALPRKGTVNVHASLLPRYRGPSPIHMALLNGDRETGVTTMLTDAGIDTGAVLLSEAMPIPEGMYFQELHDRLAVLGAEVLKKTLPLWLGGGIRPRPQDDAAATRAPILTKDAGNLDFSLGAERLANTVRAFSLWPGAAVTLCGKRLKVHRAHVGCGGPPSLAASAAAAPANVPGMVAAVTRDALSVLCGDHRTLEITELQFENGKKMKIAECWHNLQWMKSG